MAKEKSETENLKTALSDGWQSVNDTAKNAKDTARKWGNAVKDTLKKGAKNLQDKAVELNEKNEQRKQDVRNMLDAQKEERQKKDLEKYEDLNSDDKISILEKFEGFLKNNQVSGTPSTGMGFGNYTGTPEPKPTAPKQANAGGGNGGNGGGSAGGSGANKTIAEAEKFADGGKKEGEKAVLPTVSEESVTKLNETLDNAVDPKYTKNLPTWIVTAYKSGEYTHGTETTLADGTKLKGNAMDLANEKRDEIKRLKKERRELIRNGHSRGSKEVDDVNFAIEKQEGELSAIKDSKEYKDGFKRFLYLMANKIGAGLVNAYSLLILKGGGSVMTSDADKIRGANLQGALDRYNKKWADLADSTAKLLYTNADDVRNAQKRLNEWYMDAKLRPYVQALSNADKKMLLDWEKENGRELTLEDFFNIFKVNQATSGTTVGEAAGGIADTALKILGK